MLTASLKVQPQAPDLSLPEARDLARTVSVRVRWRGATHNVSNRIIFGRTRAECPAFVAADFPSPVASFASIFFAHDASVAWMTTHRASHPEGYIQPFRHFLVGRQIFETCNLHADLDLARLTRQNRTNTMTTAKKSAAKKATTGGAKPAAKRMGRPPKGDVARTVALTLRLTPAERAELDEAAEHRGLTVTDFVVAAMRAYR